MPRLGCPRYTRRMRALLCLALLAAACGGPLSADESGSQDELTSDSEDAALPTGELRSSYSFTIGSGHHKSNHDFIARPHLGKHVDRQLNFRVSFATDAAYTSSNASNQSDWNKLMGLTTDRIHKNSIRLGWRWSPGKQKVELGFYGYLDSQRVMVYLTDVAPGASIDCELRMTNAGLSVRAGNAVYTQAGSLGVGLPTTWVLHSAYFGGDETAPHDIHVNVSGISAR